MDKMDLFTAQDEIKRTLLTKAGKLNAAVIRQPAFKNSRLKRFILDATMEMKSDTAFAGRVHSVLAGIPTCPICAKRPLAYFNGLLKTCAHKECSSADITSKRLATLQAKYGAKVSPKTRESARARFEQLNIKGRATLLAKHGVSNSYLLPHIREKAKAGLLEHRLNYDSVETRKEKWSARFNIDIEDIEDHASSFVRFQCRTCQQHDVKTFYALTHRQRMLGNVCANCGNYTSGSLEQAQLYAEVKALAPDAEQNNRLVINPYELDIYIPSKRLAIEYNGIFWHSYRPTDLHPKDHQLKHKLCSEQGIRLLQFTSLHNHDKRLAVIKHCLGLDQKLGARKCEFKPVAEHEAKLALAAWHLNDSKLSVKQAFGLYHQGELMQVASFGKPRFGSEALELYRLASRPGYCIVGGVSKLLNRSLAALSQAELITYSDKFLGGTGYAAAGLELFGETPPNYWYVKPGTGEVLSRYQAQKHKLATWLPSYQHELTERENMEAAGYRIFYDAGSYKYRLRR